MDKRQRIPMMVGLTKFPRVGINHEVGQISLTQAKISLFGNVIGQHHAVGQLSFLVKQSFVQPLSNRWSPGKMINA